MAVLSCSHALPAENARSPDVTRLSSFRDYLDIALFDPGIGYYAAGRVDLRVDFRTFPVALAPSFGQMIAEQVFRMWEGMRRAGTVAPDEKFTVAEVGAGDGMLAETILDYVAERASADARWRQFDAQLLYLSFDRSPALSERQRQRNARFGERFEARSADATNLGAALPKGSITGVILSNELLDCFSVHKVTWDESGAAKVVFVAPFLPQKNGERVSLDKVAFPALLESLRDRPDYEATVARIQVDEVYAPVAAVPEVAAHVRRYAREYAKHGVAYVNLGAAQFIHAAGEALRAGYVLTIDYGAGWSGEQQLRTYGRDAQAGAANPYEAPTLRDITTDVNFGHVAAEGTQVGLEPKYFGPQHSLREGTPIVLTEAPSGADAADFRTWAKLFETWDVYKVLVQQKRGTDPAYRYPSTVAESLISAAR